jgi:Mrp family chromosome partitioning ATPase
MPDLENALKIISTTLNPGYYKDVSIQNHGKKVVFNLLMDNPADGQLKEKLIKELETKLKQEGFNELDVYTTQRPQEQAGGHRPIPGTANRGTITPKMPVEGIKHIIAINSGKGGVGKTTCSVNLAISLSKLGYKVGVLDADITGPNVHLMLGITEKPYVTEDRKVMSLEAHGIKLISMGTQADDLAWSYVGWCDQTISS